MSQVTDTYLYKAKVGETISSANANNIYSSISTASTSINKDNTRTESISRRHLKDLAESPLGEHPTFPFIYKKEQYLASANYSSTTYVDITHGGGTSTTFLAPLTLQPNECIRLQASVNMIEATKGSAGVDQDNYWFAFFLNIGGVLTQVSPDYGFGLLCNSGSTNGVYQNNNHSYSDKIYSQLIVNQREAFSYIYINKTGSPQTITLSTLRIKVETPSSGTNMQIKLKEFTFVTMGAR